MEVEDVTKTAYAGDKTFSWTKGDQISVLFHNGDDNQFFTLTAVKAGSASAQFKGEVTDGYTIGASDVGYNGVTKWALYPASASHTYTAGATYPISFHIPAEIDLSGSPSTNLPMTGCGDENDNFTFTTATACYKFTFTGLSSISKASLTIENTSNGYYLSGDSPVMFDSPDYYVNMYSGSGSKIVTITEDVSSGTAVFYVPVRGWNDGMKANITLKNMDAGANNGNIIYKASSTVTALPSISWAKIAIVPSLNVSSYGVGVPFWSAFGINWASVDMYPLDGEKDAFPGDGTKLIEWKATSDATYIYFYYKTVASYAQTGGVWSSYLPTGYDTDNNDSTGSDASYSLGGGFEANSVAHPFSNEAGSAITFYAPASPCSSSFIKCPVGSDSAGTVATNGSVKGDYAYIESRIPRSAIGSPASAATIRVRQGYGWTPSAAQTITLY